MLLRTAVTLWLCHALEGAVDQPLDAACSFVQHGAHALPPRSAAVPFADADVLRLERTIQRASEVADAVGEETQELARRLSQLKGALDGSQLTASRSPREQFPAASIANTDALAKDA
ncbi:unnamed protein product [Cladocopium goreaui]|uniref:Uncharacterized protein n=1 Tax=Cladocopium goreaui TaxID=2562237 RepID=A0A9P1FK19_9DINO|nr:unnamed protein product [Cladocopium goreaui]